MIKLAKALHSEPSQLLEDTNLLSNKNTEKLTEEKIADIIYQEKKEMIKSINKFCDDTIQKILDLE